MPIKKAFTLPAPHRYSGPPISITNLQHRYSQSHEETTPSHHTRPNGGINTNSRTRYTRPKPSFEPVLSKENSMPQRKMISVTKTQSNSLNPSQASRHIEGHYSPKKPTSTINGQLTRDSNSRRNSQTNKNIELEYLGSDIPIEMMRDSDSEKNKMSNPLQQLFNNNAYEDDNTTSTQHQGQTKQWYNDGEPSSKYGNSNVDLVSLHSMISRTKSLGGKENGDEWMVKLTYSFTGALLWSFITLCIEEIDGTASQKVCNSNQEVRYWASFVCLVVIITAATIYFQKGNVTQSIIMFLLNSVTLISINHAPLSCIKTGRLDDRDMSRLRGGFLLFLLLAITITWLLKKYLSNKKPLLW